MEVNYLSGLHFPALPAASPALIATGHFAFGYVLLLPSPLLTLVLSSGLENACIYARTVTATEEHNTAIKYSGRGRLWEVATAPAMPSEGEGPGHDYRFTGPRQPMAWMRRHRPSPHVFVLSHSSRQPRKRWLVKLHQK